MSSTSALPALTDRKYDGDGRLVGLVYDSTPPLLVPDVNSWFVAVDSSDNALRAVAQAIQLAEEMKACALHLVHVQTWLSKEAAQSELAHQGLDATARARAKLEAVGLPWRLHLLLGNPSERIIDRAIQMRGRGIIIGSRGLNVVESLLFGSVAYKVMHLSPVPVMVVP